MMNSVVEASVEGSEGFLEASGLTTALLLWYVRGTALWFCDKDKTWLITSPCEAAGGCSSCSYDQSSAQVQLLLLVTDITVGMSPYPGLP